MGSSETATRVLSWSTQHNQSTGSASFLSTLSPLPLELPSLTPWFDVNSNW
jgi:hypothetical protein